MFWIVLFIGVVWLLCDSIKIGQCSHTKRIQKFTGNTPAEPYVGTAPDPEFEPPKQSTAKD